MKNSTFRFWLFMLVLLSLFSGLSLNGQWSSSYSYTFISGPDLIIRSINSHSFDWVLFLQWLLIIASQLIIVAFPFLFTKLHSFKVWFFVVPFVFLLSQVTLYGPLMVIFIPFFILWLILLFIKVKPHKTNNQDT